jgi:branched-chain amino acid transport system ATP-binding protein
MTALESRAGARTGEVLLACRGLDAGYGGIAVVRGLDLSVAAGEVVALIGPNGAGKTTTLLTLAGDLAPISGDVTWLGQDKPQPLFRRARQGLALVTEERSVFMQLNVSDNLRIGGVSEADAVTLFPELGPLMRRTAGLLSGGEQQMLTLARALGRRPTVLLADELSLGLGPIVVERLLQAVRAVASERGVGVLLVEQHVHQALGIADRVYVMQRGRVVLTGRPAEISGQLGALHSAYLSEVQVPSSSQRESHDV